MALKTYLYPDASFINKITFHKADNGSGRAYLHVGNNAPVDQCAKIIKTLIDAGFTAIPCSCDDQPALEVRGYLREQSILTLLQKQEWIKKEVKVIAPLEKKNFVDKMKARTLQGASIAFLFGDASYAQYGYHKGHPEDMLAGISYGIGSAAMGLIGTNAQALSEIKKQTRKLLQYAKEHEIETHKNFTIPTVTENNKRDVFHKIVDFLQSYPSEIGNSFTGLAGALIAYSAYKYRVGPEYAAGQNVFKGSGFKDMGLGTTTVASGLVGALIKEKKHDPDIPYSKGMQGWWEWIQERPLSVAAFGYMISTGCHTLSTFQDYNAAKRMNIMNDLKAMKYRAGFITFTIVGEMLLMLSSKGHGEGVKSDVSTENSVIAIAAGLIAEQKPEMQLHLIETIGNFLGRPDVLALNDSAIKKKLTELVTIIKENPWAKAMEHNPQAAHMIPVGTLQSPAKWQVRSAKTTPNLHLGV